MSSRRAWASPHASCSCSSDSRCRVSELEQALSRVRQLQGLLPICAYCKRIRDDQNYWNQVETYIAEHLDVRFSHGICPSCLETVLKQDTRRAAGAVEVRRLIAGVHSRS